MSKDNLLRSLFADIIRGYTYVKENNFYIKHLSNLDGADLDESRSVFFEIAKKNKIPTIEQQENYLLKEGLWPAESEKKIKEITNFLKTLEGNKLHEALPSRINEYNKTILDERRKLNILKFQKEKLMGETAEDFAAKKVNELYMQECLYKDKNLEVPLYDDEAYDELSEQEIGELLRIYTDSSFKFSATNLKKMALSPSFLNLYYLCEDNPYSFWGKPVVALTFYQAEAFGYGKMFKNIISNSENKPPDDVINDPDKLLEWHSTNKNAQKLLDKNQDKAATSIVGATKEDLKKLNLNPIDFAEIAKKRGKEKLSMAEMMELHGE